MFKIRLLFSETETAKQVIAGESMPDPWTDDSFQRFMHNAHFTTELAKIVPRARGPS